MIICLPIRSPEGLQSRIDPHLPDAEHLLFFDTHTRVYEHVSLTDPALSCRENVRMDAVFCGSINRATLRALLNQGIKVYGIDDGTVAEAIARFENGELVATEHEPEGCHGHGQGGCCNGSGGCHGHDDKAHEKHEGCCGGHQGNAHASGHGCGGHARQTAPVPKEISGIARIAVCSQNRKTVTDHAGKCRKFWIYTISDGAIADRTLLELPMAQALHASAPDAPHPLDGIDVLLAASMGDGLRQRLQQRGIQAVITEETDPDAAVAAFLG